MHVYQDSSVDTEAVRAYAVGDGDDLTAVVDLGRGVRVHIHTPADGRVLLAAVAEAMRLLDPPVITNSARDCDEQNPDGSGEHCHRGGDHGVHQDSNGDEWRTDGAAGMQSPRPVVRVVGGREVTS